MKRMIYYFTGIFLLALGTIMSVWAGLGVGATSSIGYVLSLITKLSMGMYTILFFVGYIIIELLLSKKEQWPKILAQLLVSLLFSFLIDLINNMIVVDVDGKLFLQIVLLLVSIVIIALGAYLSIYTNFIPTAPDGCVSAIASRTNKKLGNVKNVFDIVHALVAIILSVIFLGKIEGVGIGTIASALLTGRIINHYAQKMQLNL